MTHCSDIDTLVSLTDLLGEQALAELGHVLECRQCRKHVETLTTLRSGIGPELTPGVGFSETVLRMLPAAGMGKDAGETVEKWVGLVTSPVLAALTTFLLLFQVAGAGGTSIGPHVPVMAVMVGAGVVVWNRVRLIN